MIRNDDLLHEAVEERDERRCRRLRHPWRTGAAILAASVVATGVTDMGLRHWGESRIASNFKAQHALSTTPDVSIDGDFGGWQVATGSIEGVGLRANDVPVQGAAVPMRLTSLSVQASQLEKAGSGWQAGSAHAEAYVSWEDLGTAVGSQVRYAHDGRARVTASVPIAGSRSGTTGVRVSSSTAFSFTDVELDQPTPERVQGILQQITARPVHLDGIPKGMELTTVRLDAQGLHAELSGTSVPVTT